MFRGAARSKGVEIDVNAADGPFLALGDRSSLHQVLVNLMENAVKSTNQGDRITLAVRANGDYVEVALRDTGPGIPQQRLPLIFERFYKADRRRQDSGAGLGLAIVKRIVTAHGGDVQVESREGEGSVFRVLIPKAGITLS